MRKLPTLPAWLVALLATAAGCLVTGAGLALLTKERRAEAALRQDQRIRGAQAALEGALHRDEDLLLAARAYWNGSREVTTGEWQAFVADLDLPGRHPGLKALAYLAPVSRDEAPAYLAAQRRAGNPLELHDHFTPWPGDPVPGPPAPDLIVIQDLEPAALNPGGLGLDAGANPVQRRAAERARDTGRPALTGRLTFGDLSQRDPALGLYLPVFRGGGDPGSSAARRQALQGWVSLGLWARPLFLGAFQIAGLEDQDGVEVVDLGPPGEGGGPAAVLFGQGGPLGASWRSVRTEVGGRIWELRFRKAEAPGLQAEVIAWGAGGLAFSLLIGLLAGALVKARREGRTLRRPEPEPEPEAFQDPS